MKKLDEIMELMADEMADFKASLLRLEMLSKQLDELSIPLSTEAIDKQMKNFLKDQEEDNQLKRQILLDIDEKLRGALLIPRYIIILLGVIFIIMLLIIMFLIFH